MNSRKANRKLFRRYLRYLARLARYQKVSASCKGGSWYLFADEVYEIYLENKEVGLVPLEQSTNIENIGEFFADLVVFKGSTYRLSPEFKLYYN